LAAQSNAPSTVAHPGSLRLAEMLLINEREKLGKQDVVWPEHLRNQVPLLATPSQARTVSYMDTRRDRSIYTRNGTKVSYSTHACYTRLDGQWRRVRPGALRNAPTELVVVPLGTAAEVSNAS
jgi:hypothetical protein